MSEDTDPSQLNKMIDSVLCTGSVVSPTDDPNSESWGAQPKVEGIPQTICCQRGDLQLIGDKDMPVLLLWSFSQSHLH